MLTLSLIMFSLYILHIRTYIIKFLSVRKERFFSPLLKVGYLKLCCNVHIMYIYCAWSKWETRTCGETWDGRKKCEIERSGRGWMEQCAAFTRNLSQFDCRRRRSSTLVSLFSFSQAKLWFLLGYTNVCCNIGRTPLERYGEGGGVARLIRLIETCVKLNRG